MGTCVVLVVPDDAEDVDCDEREEDEGGGAADPGAAPRQPALPRQPHHHRRVQPVVHTVQRRAAG